jgi:hypothetical protein
MIGRVRDLWEEVVEPKKKHVFAYFSLMHVSQISVQSALDNEGASCLNGVRFSTRSLIVNTVTNEMGYGTMPEIKSLYISPLIAITRLRGTYRVWSASAVL